MEFKKKILIYCIAFITLISSTGVFFNIHECISDVCKKEEKSLSDKSCCEKKKCDTNKCCSNEVKYVKRDNSKDESKRNFEIKIPKVTVLEQLFVGLVKSLFRFNYLEQSVKTLPITVIQSVKISPVILFRNFRC